MSSRNSAMGLKLSKRLQEVAAEFESEFSFEREQYDSAILTLHNKISSLRTSLDLEKSRSQRQQDLIDSLQQQLESKRSSDQYKRENMEQGKLVYEVERLRSEVTAMRFHLLNISDTEFSEENANPNALDGSMKPVKSSKSYGKQLLVAASEGDLNLVKYLLTPDSKSVSSALESYKNVLSQALISALSNPSSTVTDTCVFLLTCGADPFYMGADGNNAVHRACAFGNDRILEKMLSFGADNLTNGIEISTIPVKETGLHLAARRASGKCLKLLLRNGADVTLMNSEGQTAIDLLVSDNEISIQERKSALDILNDPNTLFWSHSVRANRLYASENYAGARSAYEEAIKLTERLPDEHITSEANCSTLYYNNARACVKTGGHCEAIKLCTKSLELRGGKYVNALAQRAASYMSLFDYGRAAQDYQMLLRNNQSPSGSSSPILSSDEWGTYLERAVDLNAKSKDHYLVLGVSQEATAAEIKKAFRTQCLRWHPDKHRGSEDDAARASIMFKAINEANEVLNNEQKRTLFDIDRISKRMDDIVKRQQEDQQEWQHTQNTYGRSSSFNQKKQKPDVDSSLDSSSSDEELDLEESEDEIFGVRPRYTSRRAIPKPWSAAPKATSSRYEQEIFSDDETDTRYTRNFR